MTITIELKFLVNLTCFILALYAGFIRDGVYSAAGFVMAIVMFYLLKDSYRDFITISK